MTGNTKYSSSSSPASLLPESSNSGHKLAGTSHKLAQIPATSHDWITQQRTDLEELLESLLFTPNDDINLRLLTQKTINHLEQYYQARSILAQRDAPSFLSPSWTTPFENAFLWIGGCRPAVFVRLVYSLFGPEIGVSLSKLLKVPGEKDGKLIEISQPQMELINALYLKTVREEEKLSFRQASLQEDIADKPLMLIASSSCGMGGSSQEVDEVLAAHGLALATLLTDADHLRLSALKELTDILTPLQAVNLLVASNRLHLTIHEWGTRRDQHL